MTNKWSIFKAMTIGVVLSPLLLTLMSFVNGTALPTMGAEFVGFVIGGMMGGAFLFAIVALIRNLFIR